MPDDDDGMAHRPIVGAPDFSASEASDIGREVYHLISARQLHYNNVLWQVPVLSLTAQAFLFTVILDASSTSTARSISAFLGLITSAASMQLMARHRQADVSDAHWLASYEKRHFPKEYWVHGPPWKHRRDTHPAGGPLAKVPYSFIIWMSVLGLFGLAALLVLGLTVVGSTALSGS